MGIFSKKNDKNQKARRKSDAENAEAGDVDLENRLGSPDDALLEDESSMNSLDYLDQTGELLERSAPTVSSQSGAVDGWHLPDLSAQDADSDMGSAESFATFFGDDDGSDEFSDEPATADLDELHTSPIPAPFETEEGDAFQERRLDDQPPMAAAGTDALAANSDFLSVEIDALPVDESPAWDAPPVTASELIASGPPVTASELIASGPPVTASELIAAAPPAAVSEPVFPEETFRVTEPLPAPPMEVVEPLAAPVLMDSPATIDMGNDGPSGSRAQTLLEILGLGPDATWNEIMEAHSGLTAELSDSTDGDPSREAVSRAIQREMNTAYAALRLMAVA